MIYKVIKIESIQRTYHARKRYFKTREWHSKSADFRPGWGHVNLRWPWNRPQWHLHLQNLISSYLSICKQCVKIWRKSISFWVTLFTNKLTNKQADRWTNDYITSVDGGGKNQIDLSCDILMWFNVSTSDAPEWYLTKYQFNTSCTMYSKMFIAPLWKIVLTILLLRIA